MKKTLLYFTVTVSILASGCNKKFEETNISPDPNVNLFPNTAYLLSQALNSSADAGYTGTTINGKSVYNTETALYVQYLSLSQYPEPSLYSTTRDDWSLWYSGPLEDLYTIIRYNSEEGLASDARVTANGSNKNQTAIVRIFKAYLFSIVTDRWGDVPYSEALLGVKNTRPKYDKQQTIYADLFKELKEANAQFDGGAKVTGDQVFNGDVAKWKKFANSLRMILAMRLSKVDPVTGKAEFISAYNDAAGFISTNADNAAYKYLNNANYCSPWSNLNNGRDDYSVSNVMINYLQGTSDPRLPFYAQPNQSGNFVGIPYGLDRNSLTSFVSANDFSRIGVAITGWKFTGSDPTLVNYNGKDGLFISASQMWFTKAEAEQRGWIGTTANASPSYQQAIKLSWEEWGVTFTPAQLTTFINQASVNPSSDILAKIGQQKWVALFPRGHEPWFEWRRTGYPVLTPTPNAVNVSKQIPRRYGYPDTEIQLNPARYQEAVSGITGGDTHIAHVWWDK